MWKLDASRCSDLTVVIVYIETEDMDSDIDLSETRQFGGGYGGYSGYGGSGYGGLGGYGLGGYGYGGFVECCEGVVDPILLLGVIVGKIMNDGD